MPSPLFISLPSPQTGLSLKLLDLRQQSQPLDALQQHLSDAEQTQSRRYRHQQAQQRFVYGRWALRVWLGQILGKAPRDEPLQHTPYGKPVLPNNALPQFNLSHAGDYVLLAVHEFWAVGVDIESARLPAPLEVIPQIFSPEEQRYYQQGQEVERFYALWTAKEAILKAWGTGFAEPATTISVIDAELHWSHTLASDTQIWPITAPAGYAAAVALTSRSARS